MLPHDPMYRALLGHYPSSLHRRGSYTPATTGYALQENAHETPSPRESPVLYEPPHLLYESESRDYEPAAPWNEPVVDPTPAIRFSAPVDDDVRPPKYENALMDDWFMARAVDEIDGPTGTLDDLVNHEGDTSLAPRDAELDRLAAGMDPSAPEAFRRLCDLPIDDLDEDQLFSAAAMLRLFAPPGAFGSGPGPLF